MWACRAQDFQFSARVGGPGPPKQNFRPQVPRGAEVPSLDRLDDEEPPCGRCFMCRISTTAPLGTTIAVLPVTGMKSAILVIAGAPAITEIRDLYFLLSR